VLRAPDRNALSFLLLDHLTVPLVGCDDHLERFASVCGLTSTDPVDLLAHRPAGGICCPGCRLAHTAPDHPLIPVGDGAVAVLACSDHESATVDRFRTGFATRQQLTATLDPTP
jgi:hypothetical protein